MLLKMVKNMNNKVLIKLNIPEIDKTYNFFIPVNERIYIIEKLLGNIVGNISNGNFNGTSEYILINSSTGKIYDQNEIIINTDIRNGTELYIIITGKKIAIKNRATINKIYKSLNFLQK